MTQPLLIERNDHITKLTINRPEARNTITDLDMVDAIVGAMAEIDADLTTRVAILTGAGKAFSAGGNLKHMRDGEGIFGGDAAQVTEGYRKGIQRVARAVWNCEVPLIAAVNGPAYGAGCDLACMCDIRIASTSAVFAENFVNVGIIPGDGGAWFLPRQIGLSRAAEMTFTADPIDAETALGWGLVSRVSTPEKLLDDAQALAARIARNPPRQLRMAKRLMRQGAGTTLDTLLEMSAVLQGACHQTEDHREAVNALLDRREGKFAGR